MNKLLNQDIDRRSSKWENTKGKIKNTKNILENSSPINVEKSILHAHEAPPTYTLENILSL